MRRRSGFTLVEVLVSMALILFIMSILAGAFGAASQAVGDLKAAGDLAERLRGASNVLRRDLRADHFTDHLNGTNPKLSDSNFWDRLNVGIISGPPLGFFRIFQQTPDSTDGGPGTVDLDGIPSFSQTTAALHYTVALSGTNRSDFLSATVPAGSPLLATNDMQLGLPDSRYQDPNGANPYNSPFAEVVVFLQQTQDVTDSGQPLFGLFRRQFLSVPTNWPSVHPSPAAAGHTEISTFNNGFNDLQIVTVPFKRFDMNASGANAAAGIPNAGAYHTLTGTLAASDLLLTDVVSFDVRILIQGNNDFVDLFDPSLTQFTGGNGGNPSFTQPNGPRVFDTWTNQNSLQTGGPDYSGPWSTPQVPATDPNTLIPLYQTAGATPQKISIKAIQLVLRVWDFKTKKTRQVTIVQQM